jgi:ribonuclease P protein component
LLNKAAAPVARLDTLKRRADFLRLKKGASWSTQAFVLQASPSPSDARAAGSPCPAPCAIKPVPGPRFGFTVSDRAVRDSDDGETRRAGAVRRNRARRRLKEAVRLVARECARPNFDYLVIGRRAALTMEFAELVNSMKHAFAKVHEPRRRRTELKPSVASA